MMCLTRIALASIATAALFGCLPEERIVWSPDGKRAAVATPNGLYFIDPTGKVLPPRLTETPVRCDWFADGRRLAVIHTTKAANWGQIAELFDAGQTSEVKRQARILRDRILAYESKDGKLDKFDLDPTRQMTPEIQIGALIYMRDHDAEGLREKIGDEWTAIEEMENAIWTLQVFKLDDDALKPDKVLTRSLAELRRPLICPKGKNIAYLKTGSAESDSAMSLHVIPAGGGRVCHVADNVAIDYDWSPDGASLAFIRSAVPPDQGQDNIHLGSLSTATVTAADGRLLAEPVAREDRVGVLFNGALGVRWLRDGRLLFSSVEVSLPATSRDMPQEWTLFVLDPRMPASVMRILGRDFVEPRDMALPLFTLSPDETRVLIPGTQGRLSMYEFASGSTVQLVDPDMAKDKTPCLPSWRNADEITYAAANKVYLWKAGKTVCLSEAWTKEMREGWLTDKQ